jgi:hypothetical protein
VELHAVSSKKLLRGFASWWRSGEGVGVHRAYCSR